MTWKGSSANASSQPFPAGTANVGTRTATNAGATVWAKNTRPFRRHLRGEGDDVAGPTAQQVAWGQCIEFSVEVRSHLGQQRVGHGVGMQDSSQCSSAVSGAAAISAMIRPLVGAPARTAPMVNAAEHADADEGGDAADAAHNHHGELPPPRPIKPNNVAMVWGQRPRRLRREGGRGRWSWCCRQRRGQGPAAHRSCHRARQAAGPSGCGMGRPG